MGGCCCSSQKPQLHGTPVYCYYPPALEERQSLRSQDGATSALTAGFLVDLNLDTSFRDAYRSPPVPLPYDIVLGHPQVIGSDTVTDTGSYHSFGTLATCEDVADSDFKTLTACLLASPKKIEPCRLKETNADSPIEEEDCCPICFEEYDAENPRTISKCQHQFHLSCILEWMERSDTCAICDQEMILD